MRRRKRIILICLLFPLTAPFCAFAAETRPATRPAVVELEMYENKQSGIALKRPKAWVNMGPAEGITASFIHLVDEGHHKTGDTISVWSVPASTWVHTGEPKLDDLVNKQLPFLEEGFSNFKVIESKDSKLNGEPARTIVVTGNDVAGDPMEARFVLCLVGKNIYYLQFQTLQRRYEQLAPTFDEVVDSFVFTEKAK